MKPILMILSTVLFALVSSSAMAATSSSQGPCAGLKEELMAMKQAQAQIMQSLVNNHETFAVTLEEYAANAEKAPKAVSKQMNKSAQAFRTRGVQAKQIAERLNRATEKYLLLLSSCIASDEAR